jgi:DnaK suppressor protein
MALTPDDVRAKRFACTRLREGYDMAEVDDFLDEVEAELSRLRSVLTDQIARRGDAPGQRPSAAAPRSFDAADSLTYPPRTNDWERGRAEMPDTSTDQDLGAQSAGDEPLPVRAGESAWTDAEVAELRETLLGERIRLLGEVTVAQREMQALLRDGGEGAGSDQADLGSNALERDAELSLVNNSRELLHQVERALQRLDSGTYGACESCGQSVGKLRLMAFPRATLCLPCKQRQERR